jgi:hypothetical protein
MPSIIVTHDVGDTDHWLASSVREQALSPLGVSNIRTFVNGQDRTKVGIVADVADLDVLLSALANPSPEMVQAMQDDTVMGETLQVYVGP